MNYNPDLWLPLYGLEFLAAVKGKSAHVKAGYIAALIYYWQVAHCRPLEDNDEFLRGICEISDADWPKSKPIIFDNDKFFRLDDDGWYQKRALKEWGIAIRLMEKKKLQTENARKARWNR